MNGRQRLSWEETALRLAFDIARYRSEDQFVQCGCCIIKNNNDIVLGYNGCPSGLDSIDLSNRDERRPFMLHAEFNSLSRILYNEVKIMAVTGIPCLECLKHSRSKNVKEIIWSDELENYPTEKSLYFAAKLGISLKRMKLDSFNIRL